MAAASSLVIFEKPPEMAMQGVKIYSLGLTMIVIGVTFFGAAPGMTHILPVGCLIACALKTGIVDKGLGKVYRMTICFLPVTAQTPQTQGQCLGGKTLYLNPGRDQETDIVGNQVEVLAFGVFIPADEQITILYLPGGRCPSQACHDLITDKNLMPYMFANEPGQSKVVIMVEKIIPQITPLRISYQSYLRFFIILDRSGKFLIDKEQRYLIKCLCPIVLLGFYAGRKFDKTLFFQSKQKIPRGTFFKFAIGLFPCPYLT